MALVNQALKYRIFSVDDHIVEPLHVWTSRLPARYAEAGPHVIAEDGKEYWVYEDRRAPTLGINAVAGKPRDEWSNDPTRFDEMIPGCFDPKARARDLLSQGVLASVNFPSLPRFGGLLFNSFHDKELADLCVRAWNDFVLDEWCTAGPRGLFVPMIICQVWDPEGAAAEVRRCAERGARALSLVENPVPSKLPGFHGTYWDPVWRACEETDLAVCMHTGSSGWMPIADPEGPSTGWTTTFIATGLVAMANLLLSPVCHRFPQIKIVFSESGIGWIPALLERADRQIDRQYNWAGGNTDMKPSDIFARNMFACMVDEPIGIRFYPEIGVDKILAETDYPHSDSTYPIVQEACEEMFGKLPDDVVSRITHQNAEQVFNWAMADDAELYRPEIVAWRETLQADPYAAMTNRSVA
jgi:predicted TIM-barrel fold metal-dependent hydrolase